MSHVPAGDPEAVRLARTRRLALFADARIARDAARETCERAREAIERAQATARREAVAEDPQT